MSNDALEMMTNLADLYVKAGFLNPTWNFDLPTDHPVVNERDALGFIKMLGLKGRQTTKWVLTSEGRGWVMDNRPDVGLSVEARKLFRKITVEYEEQGSPPLHNMAWSTGSDEEAALFDELHGEGLVEPHAANKWRLTSVGLSSIGTI
jgi:hypothetical protein